MLSKKQICTQQFTYMHFFTVKYGAVLAYVPYVKTLALTNQTNLKQGITKQTRKTNQNKANQTKH